MISLTGWLVLVEEDRLEKVIDKEGIGSDEIRPPAALKKEDEIFLGTSAENRVRVIGLFQVTSVSEEGIDLKPEIHLTQKLLELQASEIKGLKDIKELPERGIYSLGPEDYDKLREGLERLGMEESMGAGLTIPG